MQFYKYTHAHVHTHIQVSLVLPYVLQPYPVIYYAVANPVRGLLDKKKSGVYFKGPDESIKSKN